jgi:hypothetical protein
MANPAPVAAAVVTNLRLDIGVDAAGADVD